MSYVHAYMYAHGKNVYLHIFVHIYTYAYERLYLCMHVYTENILRYAHKYAFIYMRMF